MKNSSPHTVPKPLIIGAMVIGILSALAFRSLLILDQTLPSLVLPVWYFGVIGYFFFFLYRYWISAKRKRAIEEFRLIEKVEAGQCLQGQDREVLIYLLSSIKVSREHINYYTIFALSILAIMVDMALRLLR